MLVKAAAGIKVPKEDKPRDYITDAEAVEVQDSAYYLRRMADGDLIAVEPKTIPARGMAAASGSEAAHTGDKKGAE